MRPINYQLTNNFINNLISIEVTNTEIKCIELQESVRKGLEKYQTSQNIFHLAHMFGHNFTIKDSEKFIEGKTEIGDNMSLKILRNYRNAIEYIRSNKDNNYIDLNNDLYIHINKLIINDWKEEWEAKIRITNEIDTNLDDWVQLFDPSIETLDLAKEITSAFDWYKNNITRVNALVRICILHYRLIQIMPMAYMNKITLIAVMDFLLQKNGYVNESFLCVTKLFDKYGAEYLDIWKKAIESPTGNITFWIEKFTRDLAEEMKAAKQMVMDHKLNAEKPAHQPFLDLNKRQLKILRYLQTIPFVKREDYVQMFDVSTMTAFRDLNELLQKKILRIEGKGRATKYKLANR